MAEVPKASNGGANQYQAKATAVSFKQNPKNTEKPVEVITPDSQKTKTEIIKESGFTPKQVQRFQALPLTGAIF